MASKRLHGIDEEIIPDWFICPIVLELMSDPVVCSDGFTYEREAIERHLIASCKSPITNLPLASKDLVTNFALRSALSAYRAEHALDPCCPCTVAPYSRSLSFEQMPPVYEESKSSYWTDFIRTVKIIFFGGDVLR